MKTVTHSSLSLPALCTGALLLIAPMSLAQTDFEKAVKQYDGETIKGYMQPFADLFGANMQSGFYHSAEIPSEGFHISLHLIATGTFINDPRRSYQAPTPEGFSPRSFETATIVGGKGTTVPHATIHGFSFKGSDGIINSNLLSLVVPQLTISSLFGTELSARCIPLPKLGDGKFPSATLWGIGVRHSLSQYFTDSPAELAIGGFYNRFILGDYIDLRGFTASLQASRRFEVFVLYGGLGYEAGRMELAYQTTDPQAPPAVDVTLESANSVRFTVGASFDIQALQLYADASFGAVTTLTIGVGFGN